MHADAASYSGDADAQQVESLCDNLSERVETAREEQALLGQLVSTNEQTRPYRSRQYRVLLGKAQERYQRLRELVVRYCR
jgi:hypothetical protein